MDAEERFEMNERGRADAEHEPIFCECGQFLCNRTVDEYDPIILDGRFFSDYCASDMVFLRMEGIIEGVALKTKNLKS